MDARWAGFLLLALLLGMGFAGRLLLVAHPVRVGDRVEVHAHGRQRIFEVVRIIEKRVSAPLAAEALVDHSPPPPPKEWYADFARDPGAGRPTKKDRRAMDRLRNPR